MKILEILNEINQLDTFDILIFGKAINTILDELEKLSTFNINNEDCQLILDKLENLESFLSNFNDSYFLEKRDSFQKRINFIRDSLDQNSRERLE